MLVTGDERRTGGKKGYKKPEPFQVLRFVLLPQGGSSAYFLNMVSTVMTLITL